MFEQAVHPYLVREAGGMEASATESVERMSSYLGTPSNHPVHRRIALYARVSTLHGQDPEMQLRELPEYADHRGWEISGEYIDQCISGSKEFRPVLNRLTVAAHRRHLDAVLVWKIDRLGRSFQHLVNALADLADCGAALVGLRDNLDLSTPSGRLMFQIIGAKAEFEKSLIQERVKAGLRNAQAEGNCSVDCGGLWTPPGLPRCALQGLPGAPSRGTWGLGLPLCIG